MDKEEKELEMYKVAIDLVRFEGEMLWQINNAFMVVHTIFISFIAITGFSVTMENENLNLPCFIGGILGIVLIVPWYGTFLRNSKYYHFRMAQAREIEPSGWDIIRGRAKQFADGKEVTIDEPYKMGFFSNWMKNKRALNWVISVFVIIYLILVSYGIKAIDNYIKIAIVLIGIIILSNIGSFILKQEK